MHGSSETIVFSDIVGSSQLYSRLGNSKAKSLIDHGVNTMIDRVVKQGGRVVKTIGDEVMCAFDDPEPACEAAMEMNAALQRMQLQLRTGLCHGTVIHDAGDIFGDTVNNAAYLAKVAQASQIVLGPNALANLPTWLRDYCELFDRIPLKGQQQISLVYRLNWEQHRTSALDATVVAGKAVTVEHDSPRQMLLLHQQSTYTIRPGQPLRIGRDSAAVQLCVNHHNASRKHCSLYFHRGKFILEDHSTNGTYLLQTGEKEVFLRRESTPLTKDGQFSLGQPNRQASALIFKYHLD